MSIELEKFFYSPTPITLISGKEYLRMLKKNIGLKLRVIKVKVCVFDSQNNLSEKYIGFNMVACLCVIF